MLQECGSRRFSRITWNHLRLFSHLTCHVPHTLSSDFSSFLLFSCTLSLSLSLLGPFPHPLALPRPLEYRRIIIYPVNTTYQSSQQFHEIFLALFCRWESMGCIDPRQTIIYKAIGASHIVNCVVKFKNKYIQLKMFHNPAAHK